MATNPTERTSKTPSCCLDIGIFAHNESDNIARTLETLNRQDILDDPDFTIRLHVLANGCSDDTVARATAAIATLPGARDYVVHDLSEGGKSRTWNRFVHDLSRPEADLLMFCDADIDIPNADNITRLVRYRESHPGRVAGSSQAVKDITYHAGPLSPKDRLISAAGGTLYNWQKSIIGSFYIAEAAVVRTFHLPIGLPVEDGFVRAMLLTDVMRKPEDLNRIDSEEGIFHLYKSERSARAILRHQVRLVIGNAINTVVFGILHASDTPQAVLASAARDPDWLNGALRRELPRKYGYVPVNALTKRIKKFGVTPLKRKPVILVGFVFDCVVYAMAQFKMSRGVGAGFW